MNLTHSLPSGKDRWPWGLLEEANECYADACRRELEAGTLGQQAAKDQATRDKWDAMGDRQLIRDELTRFILGAIRIALEEQFEQLKALLTEALGIYPEAIRDAFAELFKRLSKPEGRSR